MCIEFCLHLVVIIRQQQADFLFSRLCLTEKCNTLPVSFDTCETVCLSRCRQQTVWCWEPRSTCRRWRTTCSPWRWCWRRGSRSREETKSTSTSCCPAPWTTPPQVQAHTYSLSGLKHRSYFQNLIASFKMCAMWQTGNSELAVGDSWDRIEKGRIS